MELFLKFLWYKAHVSGQVWEIVYDVQFFLTLKLILLKNYYDAFSTPYTISYLDPLPYSSLPSSVVPLALVPLLVSSLFPQELN